MHGVDRGHHDLTGLGVEGPVDDDPATQGGGVVEPIPPVLRVVARTAAVSVELPRIVRFDRGADIDVKT